LLHALHQQPHHRAKLMKLALILCDRKYDHNVSRVLTRLMSLGYVERIGLGVYQLTALGREAAEGLENMKWRQEHEPKRGSESYCAVCGLQFTQQNVTNTRMYCSPKCSLKAKRQRDREGRIRRGEQPVDREMA
jgi:hypothetical protein